MHLKFSLILLFLYFFSIGVYAQTTIPLIIQDQGVPVPEVLVYSTDKLRSAHSDHEGVIHWTLRNLPDTLHLSHLGYLDQTFIIQPSFFTGSPLKIVLRQKITELEVAHIESSWVKPNSMVVQSTLNEEEIDAKFLVQDIPYILQHFPSTVTTSDAGNGIGYTSIRIRGLDPTQINVMINGVPLNDAESQAVFWVDLPDLIASASDIQVQRGIGLSGAGQVAFGSSVLINTNKLNTKPYVQLESAAGSFSTFKNSLQFNSGMLGRKWNFGGRISQIQSAGFIERAKSKLRSGSLSMSYISPVRSVRFFLFDGLERTYQAWYGMPIQYADLASKRRFNPAGTEKSGEPYENQIDHYRQTHFQLLHKELFGPSWALNNTLHFTPGNGFYEEYKADQEPQEYGLQGSDAISLVRKRNLKNYFFGSIHSANYQSQGIELNTGLAWNGYLGTHFGQVVQINDLAWDHASDYYRNEAAKWSAMAFGKLNWKFQKWTLVTDLQYRWINYKYLPELGKAPSIMKVNHQFFNPKLGLSLDLNPDFQLFGFSGLAHREPNRNDYVRADQILPKPERLWDNELGARWHTKQLQIEQNFYYMLYKNQLIPTGKLNDVGAYIRSNVERSFRLGSESSLTWSPNKWQIQGNLNMSRNRTAIYNEYVDNWVSGIQETNTYSQQPIAFSPSTVANLSVEYKLVDRQRAEKQQILYLELAGQVIGRQFLDGTGQAASALPGYHLTQLAVRCHLKAAGRLGLDFRVQINNLFNERYEANGWIYRFRSTEYNPVPDDPFAAAEGSGVYHLKGLYPQAGRNLMLSCRIKFGEAQD